MMKLSTAIVLGSTVATPGEAGSGALGLEIPHRYSTRCALELALIAVGRPELHWGESNKVWTWIGDSETRCRILKAWDVDYMNGKMSFDEFVNFIRSIEPVESHESETNVSVETGEMVRQ